MLFQQKLSNWSNDLIAQGAKNTYFVSAILVSSVLLLSGCLGEDLDVVSDTVEDFTSVKAIKVEGEFLDVEYTGESGRQLVSLTTQLHSNSENKFEVVTRMEGERLIIRVNKKKVLIGSPKAVGFIKLVGPRNMELNIEATSGAISVEQVTNSTSYFDVASGSIALKNVSSNSGISIVNASGTVTGEDLAGGKIVVKNNSGNVNLTRVDSNIDVDGSSGDIKLNDINGMVNVLASSGKVELNNIKSIGLAHFSSGQLFATNTGLSIQTSLKVSSGTIYIQTASRLSDYNFNITTGSGSARVGEAASSGALNINNGSATTIRGEVSSGKIEIVN